MGGERIYRQNEADEIELNVKRSHLGGGAKRRQCGHGA